jgi:hypothetical protein
MHGPPQSMPVSVPFFTVSVQLGAVQRLIAEQAPLAQSTPVLQPPPSAHLFGQEPPQSTPVSEPFWRLSVHDGAWQVPLHTASTQSAGTEHPFPSAHWGQLPPQSTSVSSPSFVPSEQVAGGKEHTPLVHTSPCWQSGVPLQPAPVTQGVLLRPQLPPSTVGPLAKGVLPDEPPGSLLPPEHATSATTTPLVTRHQRAKDPSMLKRVP